MGIGHYFRPTIRVTHFPLKCRIYIFINTEELLKNLRTNSFAICVLLFSYWVIKVLIRKSKPTHHGRCCRGMRPIPSRFCLVHRPVSSLNSSLAQIVPLKCAHPPFDWSIGPTGLGWGKGPGNEGKGLIGRHGHGHPLWYRRI